MEQLFKKGKFFLLLFVITNVFGQSVKRLNDPSIVAQHKGWFFESWGDWRPIPKYFLEFRPILPMLQFGECGLPNINRDYKEGNDIRPLKPTGEQNLRFTQLK